MVNGEFEFNIQHSTFTIPILGQLPAGGPILT
jgi:hypothetical protein